MSLPYRSCVCAVIRSSCKPGKLLVCHRIGCKPSEGWQFPQGGINQRRNVEKELRRELREEIGTDDISVLLRSKKLFTYDFPQGTKRSRYYRGQRQRWFYCELNCPIAAIKVDGPHAEFDSIAWVSPKTALKRIVSFKKEVYQKALIHLGLIS